MKAKPRIIVVAGPTASGKSDFAVELALTHNGEIISADSRQVYEGLDVGTGKITKEEMKGVKHHMLSVYKLTDKPSVATYKEDATEILHDIIKRGKTPIICGGTGQYIDALIYDTALPVSPPNTELRKKLEELTVDELSEKLLALDPVRHSQIDKNNKVRMIRALEIIDTLGKVPVLPSPSLIYDTTLYLLNPKRETLRKRVALRIEKRLDQGMIEEVKKLLDSGITDEERLKRYGIEYYVIAKYLTGKLTLPEMKEVLLHKIMQYAKRQQTWNKKYLPIATLVPLTQKDP
jgi:tRNA dimethylallyltransferase